MPRRRIESSISIGLERPPWQRHRPDGRLARAPMIIQGQPFRHLFRLYDSGDLPIWNSYARSYTSGSDIVFRNCDLRRCRDGAGHEDFHSKRKEALRASRRVAGRGRPDGCDACQARRGRPVSSSRALAGGVHFFIRGAAGLPDLGAGFGHARKAPGLRPAGAGALRMLAITASISNFLRHLRALCHRPIVRDLYRIPITSPALPSRIPMRSVTRNRA
jgi:hypothetical protein